MTGPANDDGARPQFFDGSANRAAWVEHAGGVQADAATDPVQLETNCGSRQDKHTHE